VLAVAAMNLAEVEILGAPAVASWRYDPLLLLLRELVKCLLVTAGVERVKPPELPELLEEKRRLEDVKRAEADVVATMAVVRVRALEGVTRSILEK